MFHVSFRYIFGIPPLILVLLPVASSDCDIEGKDGREYQHILMISINYLDTMIKNRTNCPNNEPNVFKKHACDDNKEAVFLYRAAHKLKHFVKVNNSEEFNLHLSRVSQGMLQLLNCTPKIRRYQRHQATKQSESYQMTTFQLIVSIFKYFLVY
ncbi:interleukin-7 isoform X2 [Panthera pardus]|nr:interleukin-7 isoform X2 [Lynx canadensis]XP_044905690.1 interleukin-7 isoform X2 [Felis catus]XP_053752195.1 interleukin-7 isoform X2 [Panthera pardus]XP_058555890.1 interleukin-7 isoform X2 [Neofelis nebulosa]